MHHVIVWDPKNEFWEGGLIDEAALGHLKARDAVTLPIDPKDIELGGMTGYVKRGWGAGWPMDYSIPRMGCRMAIAAKSGSSQILHWVARAYPNNELREAAENNQMYRFDGSVQLVSDTSQVGAVGGTFITRSPAIKVRDLGSVDRYGGWTIRGQGEFGAMQDGVFGFALYGAIVGLRVAWCALSVTR